MSFSGSSKVGVVWKVRAGGWVLLVLGVVGCMLPLAAPADERKCILRSRSYRLERVEIGGIVQGDHNVDGIMVFPAGRLNWHRSDVDEADGAWSCALHEVGGEEAP